MKKMFKFLLVLICTLSILFVVSCESANVDTNRVFAPSDVRVTIDDLTISVFSSPKDNAKEYVVRLYSENKKGVLSKYTITEMDLFLGYQITVTNYSKYYVTVQTISNNASLKDSVESSFVECNLVNDSIVKRHSITYVLNGGENPEDATLFYEEGEQVTLPNPTKDGHRFCGWFSTSSFFGEPTLIISQYSKLDLTFYAKWVEGEPLPTSYTITYVLNGGTLPSNAPYSYKENETVNLPTPTKNGSAFEGWYLNSEGTGTKIEVISNKTTGNVKIYAIWRAKSSADLEKYYKGVVDQYDTIYSGYKLKSALRTIISVTTHKTSYEDLKSKLPYTDQDPNNSNNLLLIYSKASMSSKWTGGSTWNREHIWPQSTGWFSTSGAGADIHHLRPEDNKVNSTRGNTPYGEVKSGTNVYYNGNVLSGKKGNGYFEPNDNVKGDIARIIMYLLVRYSESDSYKITAVAQSMDLLLKWNNLDPVDSFERTRNERSFSVQGNRNPFIDHPEFAEMIWK